MSSSLDFRAATIPMVLLGAVALSLGLLGILLSSFGVDVANPGGVAGAGLTLLVGGVAISLAKNREGPSPAPAARRPFGRNARLGAGLAALVLAIPLLALVPGAAPLGGGPLVAAAVDPVAEAPSGAPLGVEGFSGSAGGATLPLVGGVGGEPSASETRLPAGARAARTELVWTASQGGSETLDLLVEAQGADGAWAAVGRASGASPLVVDATGLPEGATRVRATVAPGSPTPGQAFEGYVSAFADAIPEGYTAAGHGH